MILVVTAALAVHLISALAHLDHSLTLITYPVTLDYGEGPILYQIDAVSNGESMYGPINEIPYAVGNYPPVYHFASWFMTAFIDDLMSAGRLVSFLAALGSGLLVFTLIYSLPGHGHSPAVRAFGGILAALFFLNQYTIFLWSVTARVDTLALMLGLLGMQLFILSIDRKNLAYWFGLAFVLSVFTKQNMIAAAIATFATAFLIDRRQTYIAFTISVLAGIIGLAITYATYGEQFFLHVFSYNLNNFHWDLFLENISKLFLWRPAELLMLLFGPAYLFMRRQRPAAIPGGHKTSPDISLVLFSGFMAASLLNVIASGKTGSGFNYFIEFEAAGALLVGLITVRATTFVNSRGLNPEHAKHRRLIYLGLFILCFQTSFGWVTKHNDIKEDGISSAQRVMELVASVDGPVISEDMALLHRTGKPLLFQPFIMTQMVLEKRWNPTQLIDSLRRGEVDMIVLTSDIESETHQDRFFAAFTEIIETRYRLLEETGSFLVYVPL